MGRRTPEWQRKLRRFHPAWQVEMTHNNHYRLFHPERPDTSIWSSTPRSPHMWIYMSCWIRNVEQPPKEKTAMVQSNDNGSGDNSFSRVLYNMRQVVAEEERQMRSAGFTDRDQRYAWQVEQEYAAVANKAAQYGMSPADFVSFWEEYYYDILNESLPTRQ